MVTPRLSLVNCTQHNPRPSEREGPMIYRTFGRMGWSVSEIGYGMWGLAGWTGSDETESQDDARAGRRAWLQLLRHGLGLRQWPRRADPGRALEKPPGQDAALPPPRFHPRTCNGPHGEASTLDECFPPDHIREYTEKSLENLGVPRSTCSSSTQRHKSNGLSRCSFGTWPELSATCWRLVFRMAARLLAPPQGPIVEPTGSRSASTLERL